MTAGLGALAGTAGEWMKPMRTRQKRLGFDRNSLAHLHLRPQTGQRREYLQLDFGAGRKPNMAAFTRNKKSPVAGPNQGAYA